MARFEEGETIGATPPPSGKDEKGREYVPAAAIPAIETRSNAPHAVAARGDAEAGRMKSKMRYLKGRIDFFIEELQSLSKELEDLQESL